VKQSLSLQIGGLVTAYSINPELFFQLDKGGRKGHDQKVFKKRFRLKVRKK